MSTPNLFRLGSRTVRVLRWMIEAGEVSAATFKTFHVSLGGTTNSTHAFDRYFAGQGPSRFGYVPRTGSHGLLAREAGAVRWIGSPGPTFEARATGWLAKLTNPAIDKALAVCECELIEASTATDLAPRVSTKLVEASAVLWLTAVTSEIARRQVSL